MTRYSPDKSTLRKALEKIIAKALSDEKFKKKLLTNPNQVLKEYDIDIPHNHTIKVCENTKDVTYFVLPTKKRSELPFLEDELKGISAAAADWIWP